MYYIKYKNLKYPMVIAEEETARKMGYDFIAEDLPDGEGLLKTDGKRLWREAVKADEDRAREDDAQQENKQLKAQVQALGEQTEFMEELLAELASAVYM